MTIEVTSPRVADTARWWWVPLVTGILWIVLGLFVLAADYDSAVLIGYMVALWLLYAGVSEFDNLPLASGWRWLRATIGVLFVAGGIAALFMIGSFCFALGSLALYFDHVDPSVDAWTFFVGTIFFNVSTFAATRDTPSLTQEKRLIWPPDVLGSICFLVASWFAYVEVCPRMFDFRAIAPPGGGSAR